MKFQVPQFIEMEDKIFGPFSFKEFIYVVGGCGISYIIYRFVPFFFLAVLFIIPVMGLSLALAFYKPNNKPFIDMVESALIYFFGHKLYVWKKRTKVSVAKEVDIDTPHSLIHTQIPAITEGKLSDTNRSFDMNDGGTKQQEVNSKLNIKI